jgi:hypothetical protein
MPAVKDPETPLETLLELLTRAREFAAEIAGDPLLERILAAFERLPVPDRETILEVIERDATWCRIVEQTSDTTGITVRPNPQASLYVQIMGSANGPPAQPLRRDIDVIRFGIAQFVAMVPLFFQKGVHAHWTASARELIAESDPEHREHVAQLCREVLALIDEASDTRARAVGGGHRT